MCDETETEKAGRDRAGEEEERGRRRSRRREAPARQRQRRRSLPSPAARRGRSRRRRRRRRRDPLRARPLEPLPEVAPGPLVAAGGQRARAVVEAGRGDVGGLGLRATCRRRPAAAAELGRPRREREHAVPRRPHGQRPRGRPRLDDDERAAGRDKLPEGLHGGGLGGGSRGSPPGRRRRGRGRSESVANWRPRSPLFFFSAASLFARQ